MADISYNAPSAKYGPGLSGFALPSLLESWERSLRAGRKAEQTVREYIRDGRKLADFLADRGMPTDPQHIHREHVEAFIVHRLDSGLAASTVGAEYRRLQQLFRWLEDEDEISTNPMAKMRPPAPDTEPVAVVPVDDLRKLIAGCEGSDFVQRRDMAIVRLLFDTGMRLGEAEGIQVGDIDWDNQQVPVTGKGRKTRACPFGAKTAQALDRYVRARSRHRSALEPWLWLGAKGRFTRRGIALMLEKRSEAAGITHVHPHKARHTQAHRWLANRGSEGDLMALMGWTSREMLGRYAKSAAAERAREAHRRMALGDEV